MSSSNQNMRSPASGGAAGQAGTIGGGAGNGMAGYSAGLQGRRAAGAIRLERMM